MLKKRYRWLIWLGSFVLVISLLLNWMATQAIYGFRVNAQGDLMEGWGLIRLADSNYNKGNNLLACEDSYNGIGYLQASSGNMTRLGVPGLTGLAMFLDHAMNDLLNQSSEQASLTNATKQHYEHVIAVFGDSFKPFSRTNFGSMNNDKLRLAVLQVYQAMTPQERQQYQGWGP